MVSRATQMVHWPGQDTPACDQHALKLEKVAAFMGFHVSSTLIVEEDQIECTNCCNEAKKNK